MCKTLLISWKTSAAAILTNPMSLMSIKLILDKPFSHNLTTLLFLKDFLQWNTSRGLNLGGANCRMTNTSSPTNENCSIINMMRAVSASAMSTSVMLVGIFSSCIGPTGLPRNTPSTDLLVLDLLVTPISWILEWSFPHSQSMLLLRNSQVKFSHCQSVLFLLSSQITCFLCCLQLSLVELLQDLPKKGSWTFFFQVLNPWTLHFLPCYWRLGLLLLSDVLNFKNFCYPSCLTLGPIPFKCGQLHSFIPRAKWFFLTLPSSIIVNGILFSFLLPIDWIFFSIWGFLSFLDVLQTIFLSIHTHLYLFVSFNDIWRSSSSPFLILVLSMASYSLFFSWFFEFSPLFEGFFLCPTLSSLLPPLLELSLFSDLSLFLKWCSRSLISLNSCRISLAIDKLFISAITLPCLLAKLSKFSPSLWIRQVGSNC